MIAHTTTIPTPGLLVGSATASTRFAPPSSLHRTRHYFLPASRPWRGRARPLAFYWQRTNPGTRSTKSVSPTPVRISKTPLVAGRTSLLPKRGHGLPRRSGKTAGPTTTRGGTGTFNPLFFLHRPPPPPR